MSGMDDKPKDPAAVALGKRRAVTLTSEHQSAAAKAKAAGMTADERVELMRRAAKAPRPGRRKTA